VIVGDHGRHPPAEELLRFSEALGVNVEDGHRRTHADSDPGRVQSHVAGPEDDHLARRNTRDTAEEHAPTTESLFQVLGAFLGRHSPGDLAHGGEKGKKAILCLHSLVGYAHYLTSYEVECEHLRGCQVKVG